ncbi:MAG: hypothetical protein QXN55_00065 [Candidatus Nitrosotenuis sp.]
MKLITPILLSLAVLSQPTNASELSDNASNAGKAIVQEVAKITKAHYGCTADVNQGGFVKDDLAIFWVVEVQCDRRTAIIDRIYTVQPQAKGSEWTVTQKIDVGHHPDFTATSIKIDGDSIKIEGYNLQQKRVQRTLDIVQKKSAYDSFLTITLD